MSEEENDNQNLPEEEEKTLKARNQPVVTVNKIKPFIDNLIGNEIQTRFRVAFKARTNDPATTRKADGLTHLAYYIQEKNDISYKQTLKFKDCLITGLPEGNNLPIVLSIKADAKSKTVREKFNLNLSDCPTCKYKEYACVCEHGEDSHEGHDH